MDKFILLQTNPPRITAIPIGFSCKEWSEQSQTVYNCFPNSDHYSIIVSLPYDSSVPEPDHFYKANIFYFNLHGTSNNTVWIDNFYNPVLAYCSIPNISSGFIISEACYGAHISKKYARRNIALNFLFNGGFCLVGSTAKAYGGWRGSRLLLCADSLANLIAEYLRENHTKNNGDKISIGETIIMAKKEYSFNSEEFYDKKTILEFVLLGDPSITPIWEY